MMNIVERINKWKNKKVSGNSTSLIIGVIYFLLIAIWCLFNYRMYLLNAAFEEIDDDLTTALLAGSLVNLDDYSKREQLVIHEDDIYYEESTGGALYKGWTKKEADILLSEINYESDIIVSYDVLPNKEYLKVSNRKNSGTSGGAQDTYLNRSIQSIYESLFGNLCNSSTGGSSGATVASPAYTISIDDLIHGPIGFMLASDIEITRLDIYNIYTVNLAKRHKYLSRFFTVSDDGSVTWKTINIFGIPYNPTSTSFPSYTEFYHDVWYGKGSYKGINNMTLNEAKTHAFNYGIVIEDKDDLEDSTALEEMYNKIKARYDIDVAVINLHQELICYTDAKVSYQDWFGNSDYYNGGYVTDGSYFYFSVGKKPIVDNNEGGVNYKDKIVTSADKVNGVNDLAPCMGYSVYSYKNSNSQYGYVGTTSYTYKTLNQTVDRTNEANTIVTVDGGKYDGKNVNKTSILIELTFNIQAFPTTLFDVNITDEADSVDSNNWGSKKVTVSRMVGIKKLSE